MTGSTLLTAAALVLDFLARQVALAAYSRDSMPLPPALYSLAAFAAWSGLRAGLGVTRPSRSPGRRP